jgi:hypothetical protein
MSPVPQHVSHFDWHIVVEQEFLHPSWWLGGCSIYSSQYWAVKWTCGRSAS